MDATQKSFLPQKDHKLAKQPKMTSNLHWHPQIFEVGYCMINTMALLRWLKHNKMLVNSSCILVFSSMNIENYNPTWQQTAGREKPWWHMTLHQQIKMLFVLLAAIVSESNTPSQLLGKRYLCRIRQCTMKIYVGLTESVLSSHFHTKPDQAMLRNQLIGWD